jgi:hypothetical protein
MPQWNARAVTELYGVFAAGEAAGTTATVERITGRTPISFDQFVRDHAPPSRDPSGLSRMSRYLAR